MKTLKDEEFYDLLNSGKLIYILDPQDDIVWGVDGTSHRSVLMSKCKGGKIVKHDPKQENSDSLIRAYTGNVVLTEEEFRIF